MAEENKEANEAADTQELKAPVMMTPEMFAQYDAENLRNQPISKIPGFPPEFTLLARPVNQAMREEMDEMIYGQVQRDAQGNTKLGSLRGMKAKMVQVSIINEDGKPFFTMDQVKAMSSKTFDYIHKECQRISGMEVKTADDTSKN